ncbi:hypothetical protein ACWEKM_42925, partial [Streptomyces sp. NPDC004752]
SYQEVLPSCADDATITRTGTLFDHARNADGFLRLLSRPVPGLRPSRGRPDVAGMGLIPELGRDGDVLDRQAHTQARLPVIMECRVH